jgi:hypothetical protein
MAFFFRIPLLVIVANHLKKIFDEFQKIQRREQFMQQVLENFGLVDFSLTSLADWETLILLTASSLLVDASDP